MNKSSCSPGVKGKGGTCFSKEDLLILIKLYNRKNPKEKIKTQVKHTKRDLWRLLNARLKRNCNREWCWLEQKFVPQSYARQKLTETFKPEYPEEWKRNPYEWLSTDDIRSVMKQYEDKYPSFIFFGPVPADCPAEIRCSLSGLDVGVLATRAKKTRIGIIYNLDKHNESGSHWVACYIDVNKRRIYYFDSVGSPPPSMIYSFLLKMKESIEKYKGKKALIYVNKTQIQKGNSECGMFSMKFLISFLQGKDMREIQESRLTDKMMNDLRKQYYRQS